jgi:hypothetical protein
MRLVISLLGAGLLVVGCSDSSGDAAPAPVTDSALAVMSTSPPAPRLVSAAAAGDALLKRTELGLIIGDTDLRQYKSYTKPWEAVRVCSRVIARRGCCSVKRSRRPVTRLRWVTATVVRVGRAPRS